jgi:NAD(P)-dependent dehydrogenase (short-subunit alcohol dehydrogenase family)
MSLSGRTALITGAASGIGRATAELLFSRGASVVLFDLDPAVENVTHLLTASSAEVWAAFVCGDVTDPIALARAVTLAEDSTGRLDIVIHAAACSEGGNVLTTDATRWDRVLSVNLTAAYYLSRVTVPALSKTNGSLVLIGSQLGLVGAQQSVAYTASKGGLVNLTRSLALDHAVDGVRVNCLCPGPTQTPFLDASFARTDNSASAHAAAVAKVPMGRFADPKEIARCAAFLASDEASFVTGTTLVVDGGYLAQ